MCVVEVQFHLIVEIVICGKRLLLRGDFGTKKVCWKGVRTQKMSITVPLFQTGRRMIPGEEGSSGCIFPGEEGS